MPVALEVASPLTITEKSFYENFMKKCEKSQNEGLQQTIKSFDKLNRKGLHEKILDKKENEIQVIFLQKLYMNIKKTVFFKLKCINKDLKVAKE